LLAFLGVTERKKRSYVFNHVTDNCTVDEYAVTQIPKSGRYSKPCDLVLTFQGFISAVSSYLNDQGRKMRKFNLACAEAIVGMTVLAQIQKREDRQTIATLTSKHAAEVTWRTRVIGDNLELSNRMSEYAFECAKRQRTILRIEREKLLLANGVYNIIRDKLELNPEYKDNRPANADAQLVRLIMKSFWQRGLVEKANHRTLFKNLDCLRTGMALIISHRMKRWKEHFWKGVK
jgi:hypothetical protein